MTAIVIGALICTPLIGCVLVLSWMKDRKASPAAPLAQPSAGDDGGARALYPEAQPWLPSHSLPRPHEVDWFAVGRAMTAADVAEWERAQTGARAARDRMLAEDPEYREWLAHKAFAAYDDQRDDELGRADEVRKAQREGA